MLGLDQQLAGLSNGTTLVLVVAIACLLGLRHATDPDHLAAVTTLIAGGRERGTKLAGRLGLSWGVGHAVSLFAFGLPIVMFRAYLPPALQDAAETCVGMLIVGLSAWLLVRWRRGVFHVHSHGGRVRSPAQAFGIGLLHGMGGSAGVGVLLLAGIHSRALGVAALTVFSVCTALSMAVLSTGFGFTLTSARVQRSFNLIAPVLGLASLAFGVWYALAALNMAPYTL